MKYSALGSLNDRHQQVRRKQNAQKEKCSDKMKLAKLQTVDLDLLEEQHGDMCEVTQIIEKVRRMNKKGFC